MGVSRRAFLRCAACVPFAGTGRLAASTSGATEHDDAHILLVNSSNLLPESFEGYKTCVASAGFNYAVAAPGRNSDSSLVLAPAAALTNANEARWLRRRAEDGCLVLVESGAMFLSTADFLRHQSTVQSVFGVSALPPVDLWRQPVWGVPYVDFTWPIPARVRDFSRLVPLAPLVPLAAKRNAENHAPAIAHIGSAAAAVKIRAGDGTLVFLGSPLGPHLLSGDVEARNWFQALAAASRPHPRRGARRA